MNPNDSTSIKFASCQCEHIAHFEQSKRTPNGNPGHRYAARFNPATMKIVKTECGTFHICADCEKDCLHISILASGS